METLQIIGVVLLILGVIFFFQKRFGEKKLAEIALAEKLTAKEINDRASSGSSGKLVQVSGTVESDTPLTGQMSQEQCVYCRTSVYRDYEETTYQQDADGRDAPTTRRGSERLSYAENHTHFFVNDETGRVRVDPKGADIDLTRVVDNFDTGNSLQFSGDNLKWGRFSFNISSKGMGSRGSTTLGYRFIEEIMPLNQQVLVLGEAGSGAHEVTISKPGKGNFIISTKSAEGLASSVEGKVRFMKTAYIICLIAGAGFLIAGFFA